MSDQFTSEARKLWMRIPENIREELLASVWCSTCCSVATITNYIGNVKNGSLILKGKCKHCGNDAARLIEGE